MPTSRQATMGLAALGLICVIILALWLLRAAAPDRESIRCDFERRLEELECAAAQDPERGDRLAEELLADGSCRKEARALYLKLERRHSTLHALAQLERAARKDVPSFLPRSRDLSPRSHLELAALVDEGRSLLGNYGATRYAAPLRESLSLLENRLAMENTLASKEFLKLSVAARKATESGDFSTALRLIEAFRSRFPDHDEMVSQLQEFRAAALRKAALEGARLIVEARREASASKAGKAIRTLESALPQYEGLPEHARIESEIRELRNR